tara:strand:+ start:274 stop:597 length:324 start_codon:yes stop_codon:yes gene_type:complete
MGEFAQGSQYSSAITSFVIVKDEDVERFFFPHYHLYYNLSFELVSGALDEAISASHCRQREMEKSIARIDLYPGKISNVMRMKNSVVKPVVVEYATPASNKARTQDS